MASRKRKSTASRPTTQYDTRQFQSLEAWNRYTDNILGWNILSKRNVKLYHTEFNEFQVELERRNLHKCLANLQDGSIDVAVVKEFYVDLYTTEDQAPKLRTNHQEIEAMLCIPRKGFVLNAEGQPWKLLRKDLATLAQTWSVFSYSNLAPTSHTSDLNIDRVRLVYGFMTNTDMNIRTSPHSTHNKDKNTTWTEYKEKDLDRINPVSRAEALIPDDVNLSRSESLDIGYGGLDDATSSKGG
ncbi:hypothetical protein GmHk_18G052375 [Glycine max]|nr:hypothetical protein GmHk_18G052375 [Glycine max]